MDHVVSLLGAEDLDPFAHHLARQAGESGRYGLPVFNPFEPGHAWEAADIRARRESLWSTSPGARGWGRTWGIHDGASIVGHAEVEGSGIEADQHRVRLGMGVERVYHRRGMGRALLDACLRWCEREPVVDWVDLGVFAHNRPALELYLALGFEEVGRAADRFRVAGERITDVQLVRFVGRDV